MKGVGFQKLKGPNGRWCIPSINGGIFSPFGPGIPPAGVNGFCGLSGGFLSTLAPGRIAVVAAVAVVAVSFDLSSGCFWSLREEKSPIDSILLDNRFVNK